MYQAAEKGRPQNRKHSFQTQTTMRPQRNELWVEDYEEEGKMKKPQRIRHIREQGALSDEFSVLERFVQRNPESERQKERNVDRWEGPHHGKR